MKTYHRVYILSQNIRPLLLHSSYFLSQKTNKLEWVTNLQTLILIINNFDINYKLVFLIKEYFSLFVEIMLTDVISLSQINRIRIKAWPITSRWEKEANVYLLVDTCHDTSYHGWSSDFLKEIQPFIDICLSSGLTIQENFAYHYLFDNHPQGCSGDWFYGSFHLALTLLLTLGSQPKV